MHCLYVTHSKKTKKEIQKTPGKLTIKTPRLYLLFVGSPDGENWRGHSNIDTRKITTTKTHGQGYPNSVEYYCLQPIQNNENKENLFRYSFMIFNGLRFNACKLLPMLRKLNTPLWFYPLYIRGPKIQYSCCKSQRERYSFKILHT